MGIKDNLRALNRKNISGVKNIPPCLYKIPSFFDTHRFWPLHHLPFLISDRSLQLRPSLQRPIAPPASAARGPHWRGIWAVPPSFFHIHVGAVQLWLQDMMQCFRWEVTSIVSFSLILKFALFPWKHRMVKPEQDIEVLCPALLLNRRRNRILEEWKSQFGFPRNRPQDKDLRVSSLRGAPQKCQWGSGQGEQGREGSQ